jgi:cobalt-zinc-cadmium resistance protein CzcA
MDSLITFALKQRVIMLVLFFATLAAGLFAFSQLNIEAYPDPTPPMVDVITQSAGLSAEEVERYINTDRGTDRGSTESSIDPNDFALRTLRR